MRVKLVQIGNSTGVRLPKSVIQACGFESEIELTLRDRTVILTVPQADRTVWGDLIQDSIRQKPIQEKGEWEW